MGKNVQLTALLLGSTLGSALDKGSRDRWFDVSTGHCYRVASIAWMNTCLIPLVFPKSVKKVSELVGGSLLEVALSIARKCPAAVDKETNKLSF